MDTHGGRILLASGALGGAGSHIPGITVLAALVLVMIAGVTALFSPWWRRRATSAVGMAAGGVLGVYLVARAIAEFWVVDYSNPASYRHSWGGPSLAGVFAVHSGPGLAVLATAAVWLYRRRLRKRQRKGLAAVTSSAGHL